MGHLLCTKLPGTLCTLTFQSFQNIYEVKNIMIPILKKSKTNEGLVK